MLGDSGVRGIGRAGVTLNIVPGLRIRVLWLAVVYFGGGCCSGYLGPEDISGAGDPLLCDSLSSPPQLLISLDPNVPHTS